MLTKSLVTVIIRKDGIVIANGVQATNKVTNRLIDLNKGAHQAINMLHYMRDGKTYRYTDSIEGHKVTVSVKPIPTYKY